MGAGSDGVELQRRFLNRLHLESLFGGLSPFPSPFELAGARAGVFSRAHDRDAQLAEVPSSGRGGATRWR